MAAKRLVGRVRAAVFCRLVAFPLAVRAVAATVTCDSLIFCHGCVRALRARALARAHKYAHRMHHRACCARCRDICASSRGAHAPPTRASLPAINDAPSTFIPVFAICTLRARRNIYLHIAPRDSLRHRETTRVARIANNDTTARRPAQGARNDKRRSPL